MRAAVYEGIEKIVIVEVEKPKCSKDNAILKVKSCAICGTDVRTYFHGKANVKPPQIIGHEIAGIIEETGENMENFRKGDRVSMAAIVSCGICGYCRKGIPNLCENFSAIGYEHPGGFAEFTAVPAQMLKDGSVNRIPENISFDEASIIEPFACAMNGQELSRVGKGDTVLIIGAGPIGCMHIALARANGAGKVFLSEISADRLQTAKQFNADVYIDASSEDVVERVRKETSNRGADVVIIAAPSRKAQEDALKMAACRGRVNFFGGLPGDDSHVKLDSNIIHYREIFVHGTSGSLPVHNRKSLELFASGKVDAKKFISQKLPLEKIVEGIEIVKSAKGLKVIINP